jgi:hypothetical protein
MLQVRSAVCRRDDYPPYRDDREDSDPEYPVDCACTHGYDYHDFSTDDQPCWWPGCPCRKYEAPIDPSASPEDPTPRRTGASK